MRNIIFPILAGIFIALQGIFNARLGEKIGFWETNTVVHATGLTLSIIILTFAGNGSFLRIGEVNKLYLFGGALGVMIIFSVMKGIAALGAAMTVAVLLVTQLLVATAIDVFGLFGSTPIKFDYTKLLGLIIMTVGIIVFKIRG
ncbi:MAG: DMT family transporter [Caulobacteraceae bacterium]